MIYEKYYFAYINTNKSHNVFYIGVTDNLLNRNNQHKDKENKNSFTAKYNVNKREKQIKAGSRRKKIVLVNKMNPVWRDLTLDW